MPVLDTVGDYLVEARRLLQDEFAPYRYEDDDLVEGLNIAMLEARRLRADLFVTLKFEIPYFVSTGTIDKLAKVPIEPMYRQSFVYYIVGRAQLRDDEATTDQRSMAMMAKFTQQLITIAS